MFSEIQTFFEFLDILNFTLFYLTCTATYWLVIYDSYKNRQLQWDFWIRTSRIHQGYYQNIDRNSAQTRKYFASGTVIILLNVTALFVQCLFEDVTAHTHKVMQFWFDMVFDHRLYFYFIHLEVILIQLRGIKTELQMGFSWKRFVNFYKSVYDMCDDLNRIFGWSHVALSLMTLQSIVTFSNFIYRQIGRKFEKFNYGE